MSKETDYLAWRKAMKDLAEARDRIAELEDLLRRLAETQAVHITRDRFQMFRQEARSLLNGEKGNNNARPETNV